MIGHFAILHNGEMVSCDILTASSWMDKHPELITIAYDKWEYYEISTVFLPIALSHIRGSDRTPIHFETVIWRSNNELRKCVYKTLEDAKAGHAHWLRTIKENPAFI